MAKSTEQKVADAFKTLLNRAEQVRVDNKSHQRHRQLHREVEHDPEAARRIRRSSLMTGVWTLSSTIRVTLFSPWRTAKRAPESLFTA